MTAVTSGRLQDIEETLKIVKEDKLLAKLGKISLPDVWGLSKEKWIKALEFEKKQEIAKIKFFNKLRGSKGK